MVTKHSRSVLAKVPGRALVWATATGIGLGIAYVLSPVSVWFFIAITGLFIWVSRGLPDRERRWVLGTLTIAVVLRVLAIAVLFLGSPTGSCGWGTPIPSGAAAAAGKLWVGDFEAAGGTSYTTEVCSPLTVGNDLFVSFFWDGDGSAMKRRTVSIQNIWRGIPIDPFLFSVAFDPNYGWTTYVYVLAYIQYWLGSAPYGIHLINVVAFLASTLLLYRLVRSSYGRAAALVGLVLLVFLPTPFAWSVSAMKEQLYILLGVSTVVATVAVVRTNGVVKRIAPLLLLVGSLSVIETVRVGGSLIFGTGLGAGVAGGVIIRRVSLILLAFLLVPYAGYRTLGNADVQARIMSQLQRFAVMHVGHVRTEGNFYKLLDQRFYSSQADTGFDQAGRRNIVNSIETMTPVEALRFSGRALGYFVVAPLPWQVQSRAEMVFLAQQVVWYLMVVLAAIGVVAGLRRDPLVTCLLCGVTVAGSVAIALNSGNIGTMVRHRDTVVPFVVWLSALGAVTTASNWMSWATPGTLDSE
jgi:hypothetical protein